MDKWIFLEPKWLLWFCVCIFYSPFTGEVSKRVFTKPLIPVCFGTNLLSHSLTSLKPSDLFWGSGWVKESVDLDVAL